MNIDPREFLSVRDWCDATTLALSQLMIVPIMIDPKKWVEWGLTVIQSPKVSKFQPPDPRDFPEWREWALRFNQAVPL